MRASVINQYLRQDTTASCLRRLLDEFAGQPSAQFRGLVAWASASGLRLIEPALRSFLDAGHSVFWIVGVDLGGTGREALQFLFDLRRQYPGRVDARVFSTGDNHSIFHSKVYWLDSRQRKVVIVGSANATTGGLLRNFETSLELEIAPFVDDELLRDLDFLWVSYSSPLPPLTGANLLEIDQDIIRRVGNDDPPTDPRPRQPHPLRPLIPVLGPQRRRTSARRAGRRARPGQVAQGRRQRQLVMDILQETRQTQVQLPVDALPRFFDPSGVRDEIELRLQIRGQIVKADVRPIIHLENNTHRLELDAIRGLPRPQIVRFTRVGGRHNVIDYEVVLNGTQEYADLDRLLDTRGQQTRQGARRWLIR